MVWRYGLNHTLAISNKGNREARCPTPVRFAGRIKYSFRPDQAEADELL